MILSDKQMHVSRTALVKLESALDAIKSQSDSPGWVRHIEIDAIESQIEEIRADMARYENLRAGQVEFPESCTLEELPTRLIEIRIASHLTQTDLAGKLGLKPQQIQRYEASRYSGASLARLTNVANALLHDKEMPIKLGNQKRTDEIKSSYQNEWPKEHDASTPITPAIRSRDLHRKPKHDELHKECPLNPETALKQALYRSSVIQEELAALLNDLWIPDLPTHKRTQIASSLFNLTLEHAWSITLLCQNELYGSALALTRSVVEVCCRGRWIKYDAKSGVVEDFSSRRFPDMHTLIERKMSRVLDPNGNMDDLFSRVYKSLSEYTHGGDRMIKMQLSETGIASDYDLEEVGDALSVSDVMQLQAASELLDFARCRNDDYCRSLRETHAQCERFQADMGKIRHLIQLL